MGHGVPVSPNFRRILLKTATNKIKKFVYAAEFSSPHIFAPERKGQSSTTFGWMGDWAGPKAGTFTGQGQTLVLKTGAANTHLHLFQDR